MKDCMIYAKKRSASPSFKYTQQQDLKDLRDLLELDLILLVGSDLTWVKPELQTAAALIKAPCAGGEEGQGDDDDGGGGGGNAAAKSNDRQEDSGSEGNAEEVNVFELDPEDPGIDWDVCEKDAPEGRDFADFESGDAIATVFFFNPTLQAKYSKFWDRLQKGWLAAYRKPITAKQLEDPPAYYTPAEKAFCTVATDKLVAKLSAYERTQLGLGPPPATAGSDDVGGSTQAAPAAPAAAADGGSTQAGQRVVDIRRLDAWRNGPRALDFSSTPLPPTDLEFANYRPGFAYAVLFFFKLALRTQFPDFWSALHEGWTAVYKVPMNANDLIHHPRFGDMAYTEDEVAWCIKTRVDLIKELKDGERSQLGLPNLKSGYAS